MTNDDVPSPWDWVREQVEKFEATGGAEGNTLMDTGMEIIVVTMRGVKSGAISKVPLMRVEHDGEYSLVDSHGGATKNTPWGTDQRAANKATIQDGSDWFSVTVLEIL